WPRSATRAALAILTMFGEFAASMVDEVQSHLEFRIEDRNDCGHVARLRSNLGRSFGPPGDRGPAGRPIRTVLPSPRSRPGVPSACRRRLSSPPRAVYTKKVS